MTVPIPFPTFDDIRKILNFWIDQQNKWFYFEIEAIQAGSEEEREVPAQNQVMDYMILGSRMTKSNELIHYIQNRIVGRISDVIPYPPSLLLRDASIFTSAFDYSINYSQQTTNIVSTEKRKTYGLVFSQITYYEPIENIESFLNKDYRVSKREV